MKLKNMCKIIFTLSLAKYTPPERIMYMGGGFVNKYMRLKKMA